jgi:hypothetical protein
LSYHVAKRKSKDAHPPLKLDAFLLEASTHYLFETCVKLLSFYLSFVYFPAVAILALSLRTLSPKKKNFQAEESGYSDSRLKKLAASRFAVAGGIA